MEKYGKALVVIATIALVGYVYFMVRNFEKDRERAVNLEQQLREYVNKNGEHVARIEYYENQSTKALLEKRTAEAEVQRLQALVAQYEKDLKKGGSVTIIKGETRVDTIIKEVRVKGDSIWPTYLGTVELDKWATIDVEADKDSISLGLRIMNEYSLVFGREKSGFLGLGKRQPFAQVTNHNPYSVTKTLKTYSVEVPRPSRLGVGPVLGYGLKAGDESWGLMLGIGVSYHLIRF